MSHSISTMCGSRIATLLAVSWLLLTPLNCNEARAQLTVWTGDVGDWVDPDNWSASVPTPNTNAARIDNGGTARIISSVAARNALVGDVTGTSGMLEISSAGNAVFMNVNVGTRGTGELLIENGGTLVTNTPSNAIGDTIAGVVDSMGTATITGQGSSWTSTGAILVATRGTGTLTIESQGTLTTDGGEIGFGPEGIGTVTVDGIGSTWNSDTSIFVGRSGSGMLTIQNGGQVDSTTGGQIGDGISNSSGTFNGTGMVIVTGIGSRWTGTDFIVGSRGSGSMSILDGGRIESSRGILGLDAGTSGTVVVDGSGSMWNNDTNQVIVGMRGDGIMEVRDGGVVSSVGIVIGGVTAGNSNGEVTIDGAGSTWSNSGELRVGNVGTGTLNVLNSATINSVGGVIGNSRTGTANIRNPDSVWTNTGELLVANNNATATLLIENGASVSSDSGTIAGNNATATVGVSGPGSSLTFAEILHIGFLGLGQLNVLDGGMLMTNAVDLGFANTGDAAVTVADNATWVSNDSVTVGVEGAGTIELRDGGGLTVGGGAGTVELASQNLSAGMLRIGEGGTAGVLDAAQVSGGAGDANVVFNHTEGQYTFSAALVSNLSVRHDGEGTTVLQAVNTYTGETLVNAGTVLVDGELGSGNVHVANPATLGGVGIVNGDTTVEGILSPGFSPGILDFDNDLTLAATSTTAIELAGIIPGSGYDQIGVNGDAMLDGTLALALLESFSIDVNQQFTIIDVTGLRSGMFAGLDEGALVGNFDGIDLLITYFGGDGNDVVLFTAVPEPSSLILLFGLTMCAIRQIRMTDSQA